MKARLIILVSLAAALAACGSASTAWTPLPSGAEPPEACARADADDLIVISADQLRFSAPCMVAPAGGAFVVRFTNDESEPHNVAIYTDSSKATSIVVSETITGPNKTVDTPVEVLAVGDYYFDCVIHPAAMNGALYVR
jgi:plastocyanin